MSTKVKPSAKVQPFVCKNIPAREGTTFYEGFFNSKETYIHPSSIIGPDVSLGENVKIGPYCTVVGKTTIGNGTRLHGYVSIGMPAQDLNTKKPLGNVIVGENCDIREFVTISSPKINDNQTIIGNNCYIMNFTHIAHDVVLEDYVTLINSVNLAGHVHIGHHTMLMANTAIHQFCRVGAYSALAPFSGMRQDLPPFCLFNGRPGRFNALNIVALRRAGISSDDIGKIKTVTKLFFQDKLPFKTILELIEADKTMKTNKYVQMFTAFVESSDRGITRKTTVDEK